MGSAARAFPDKAALVAPNGVTTHGQFEARQTQVAGALRAGGIGSGDLVAVLSANRREYLEVTSGALRMGAVPIPIHAASTDAEAGYILEDSGARWLFTDRTIEVPPSVERAITFGDAYERCLYETDPAPLADVTLTRPMHYTSGTTGHPKGVWVPPKDEADAIDASSSFRTLWSLSADDIHLVCSPLSHSAPHRFAIRTLETGGTVALQNRFDAEETLAAIAAFGVTTTFVVPTHLERILALGERIVGRRDLSSLKVMAHAGAPIRNETKTEAMRIFPPGSVWEFYGSTEGQATRISDREWLAKPNSVGTALPDTDLRILSSSGEEVAPGEVGEIWIRPPSGERFEYWRAPEKTATAWRGDFFTVGDLGYLDEDGYLFLTGRKNDTIISGGVNVYPQEVEMELTSHPSVREAVVYGVEDREWGQQVRARVSLEPGDQIDPEELRKWLRGRLAPYKVPKLIEIVDELPKTPTGKLIRGPS